MPQTLTFSKVFTAEGEKNGKPWTRWDFKTADGQRYVTFNKGLANKIETDVPVTVEIEGENKISAVLTPNGSQAARNQQAAPELDDARQGVRSHPVAPQRDFQKEAEGKTRCALVSALLPALFTAQVEAGGKPSPENARVLLEWAFNYVFTPNDVPF